MKENFDRSLELVLIHEGGWADHPQDPGGATMKGVTLTVFQRYYGLNRTKNDLRNITNEQLAHIYRTGYWDKCQCDQLPAGLDYAVFDSAVNSGTARGAKWLQAAIGAVQDGSIGPRTLERVARQDPKDIIDTMLDLRLRFLQSLRIWQTFGRGWRRRVEGVRCEALRMAGESSEQGSVTPDVSFDVVRRGSTGEWVIKLQTALSAELPALNLRVDGDFGASTETALKTFQEQNGLVADGIAGRNTYRALGLIA